MSDAAARPGVPAARDCGGVPPPSVAAGPCALWVVWLWARGVCAEPFPAGWGAVPYGSAARLSAAAGLWAPWVVWSWVRGASAEPFPGGQGDVPYGGAARLSVAAGPCAPSAVRPLARGVCAEPFPGGRGVSAYGSVALPSAAARPRVSSAVCPAPRAACGACSAGGAVPGVPSDDAPVGPPGRGDVGVSAGKDGCLSPAARAVPASGSPEAPASISTYGRIRSGSKSSAAAAWAVRASRRASAARRVQAQAGVLSRCLGAPHSGHGWPLGGSTCSSLPSRTPEIIQIFSTVRSRSHRNHSFQKGPAGHNRSQRSRWKMSQETREVTWPGTRTPPR